MVLNKQEIIKLIKEIKVNIKEVENIQTTPAGTGVVQQATVKPSPAAAGTQASQQPAQMPAVVVPLLQGFADMLFATKHPQYNAIKPWLSSIGVRPK